MSFQPVVPATGLVGWRFLQRTYDQQLDVFSGSAERDREAQYFTNNISKVKTAGDLVSDRRLLSVALDAFGLQDDINNTYFIRKILEDGVTSDDALANRLSDKRYRAFSEAFGLGPGETAKTGLITDMDEVLHKAQVAQFEVSVGDQDDSMRVALYAQHELADLAGRNLSDNAKWFNLMSVPPLRGMMETALGLPSSFGQLDIDQQLGVFRDKLQRLTGSSDIGQFSDKTAVDRLTTAYLARAQIASLGGGTSPARTALTLLQSIG